MVQTDPCQAVPVEPTTPGTAGQGQQPAHTDASPSYDRMCSAVIFSD